MQFTEKDVDAWISATGDSDATNLAEMHCSKELSELAAAARAFDRAFQKIQKTFPDANIYSQNQGLRLMLGSSHEEISARNDKARQDRGVEIPNWPSMIYVSGGDW